MSSKTRVLTVDSPFGKFRLISSGRALREILLPSQLQPDDRIDDRPNDVLRQAVDELQAYFDGELTDFRTHCEPVRGTKFQLQVWQELRRIPPGVTISYSELAARVGRPAAVRAVGAANGRNPLPVIVPCHRVIGANGSLTGYAGGLALKEQLLKHERQFAAKSPAAEPAAPVGS